MNSSTVATSLYTGLVLAVHPTTRGFGWVLFENPQTPVAWSIVHARAGRDQHLIARFERLLDRYEPAVLVMEAFENGTSRRNARIQQLYRALVHEASVRAIEVPIFDRETIQAAFEKSGAKTRNEIARVIAERVEAFSHRLPPKRKLGNSDDTRQSLFDAAALALTYFAYRGDLD
jgi:Holliday junction resolvasome RuvABC endonuclease subunit